jgi:hypothetical protein
VVGPRCKMGDGEAPMRAKLPAKVDDLNRKARRLLGYLHDQHLEHAGSAFWIDPDQEVFNATALDHETYRAAASRLVQGDLAEWMGDDGGIALMTSGARLIDHPDELEGALPVNEEPDSEPEPKPREKSLLPLALAGAAGTQLGKKPAARGTMSDTADNRKVCKIFISHSKADAKLAKALIDLIEAGVEAPTGTIRCTSIPGYKLDGGDDAPEVLRKNLSECGVVLGVLTTPGLASSYVLMELGAAWAFEKTAIPLLAPGVPFEALPGPFKDIHALKIDDATDMAGLCGTIAKRVSLPETHNAPKVQAALRALVEASAPVPL